MFYSQTKHSDIQTCTWTLFEQGRIYIHSVYKSLLLILWKKKWTGLEDDISIFTLV